MPTTAASRPKATAMSSPFADALGHALGLTWRAMQAVAVAERRQHGSKGTYASCEIMADGTVSLHAHGHQANAPRSAHQDLAQIVHLQEVHAQARSAFDLCVALLRSVPGCAHAPVRVLCHHGSNRANPPVAVVLDNIPFQNERAVQAGLLARRLDTVRGMLAALDWSGPPLRWCMDASFASDRHVFTGPDLETAAIKRFLLVHGDSPAESLRTRGHLSFHLPVRVPDDDRARQQALIAQVLAAHTG